MDHISVSVFYIITKGCLYFPCYAGDGIGNKPPPNNRSLMEIVSFIKRSKIGIQDWSLSDLTIGLYLIYLRQASTHPFEDIKGIQISSESIVTSETVLFFKGLRHIISCDIEISSVM